MALIEIVQSEMDYFREQIEKIAESNENDAQEESDRVIMSLLRHLELDEIAEAWSIVPKEYE